MVACCFRVVWLENLHIKAWNKLKGSIWTITCKDFRVGPTCSSLWPSWPGSWTPIKIHSAFFTVFLKPCSSCGEQWERFPWLRLTCFDSITQLRGGTAGVPDNKCDLPSDSYPLTEESLWGEKTLYGLKHETFLSKFCCNFILKQTISLPEINIKQEEIKLY